MAWLLHLREYTESKRILEITLFVYLTGFFFFPSSNSHKNFFYLAVLLPFLLSVSLAELKRLTGSKIFWSVLVFLFYIYLTICWNPQTKLVEYFSYFSRMVTTLVFVAVVCRLDNRDSTYLSKVFQWLVWVSGIMAGISMMLFYSDHTFPASRLEHWGGLYHSTVGGSCYGLAIVVCFYRYLIYRRPVRYWPYILILLVLLVDIALTLSRGIWLALAVSLVVGETVRGNYRFITLLVFAVTLYLLLIHFDVMVPSWYFARDGGDSYRYTAWRHVLSRFAQAPWFGYGVNTDETIALAGGGSLVHAHSVYFAHLLYGGAIALILLLTVAATSLIQGFRQSLSEGDVTVLAMAVFALVCVATDNHQLLLNPAQLWLYYWFPIAVLAAGELRAEPYRQQIRQTKAFAAESQ